MARPIQYKNEQIGAALKETHGLISLAAERLGCDYKTVHNRVKRSKDLQRIVNHYRSRRVDTAELKLDTAILNGEPWAVALVLKTLGKKRGYVERSELTGKNGKAIEIKAFDYSTAVAPIAPRSGGNRDTSGQDQGVLHGPKVRENTDGG